MKLAKNNPETVEKARTLMERQIRSDGSAGRRPARRQPNQPRKNRAEEERVLMSLVLQNAVETSRPIIDQMRHNLAVSMPDSPIFVDGDMTRLARCWPSLSNNAAKYTPPGGQITLWLNDNRTKRS